MSPGRPELPSRTKTTSCDCGTFSHDSGIPDFSSVQVVGVSAIINHHAYSTWSKENDMSLLKLQQPLVFNQFVRPINIWMTPLPVFRKCTVTGWGSTRESKQLFGWIACPPRMVQADGRVLLLYRLQTVLEFTGCRR